MARGRVTARLAGAVLSALVGGGLGAIALTPASAGAAAPVTAAVTTTVVTKAAAASCATGKYQKQVEGYLKQLGGYGTVTVDGKQSAADCAAIVKFQKRFGISPAKGLAGPTTWDVAKRIGLTKTAACKPKKKGITFCVDLTHQTTWVMKNGKVYLKPTVTRTGEPTEILVKGRHDPCLLPRFVPMGEAMVALVLVDHLMRAGVSRL